MNKMIPVLLFLALAIAFGMPQAEADSLTNSVATVKIDSSANTVEIDSTTNTVKAEAMGTVSASTTVASTTAVAVTALSGRDYIEIAVGYNAAMSNQIWVGIGTTTPSVGTGRLVTVDNPLRLNADDGVAFGTIASEACYMCVTQGKYD